MERKQKKQEQKKVKSSPSYLEIAHNPDTKVGIFKKALAFIKRLGSLAMFQLKDKIDMSYTKSKKAMVQKIVFSILKFVIILGLVIALCILFIMLGIFYATDLVNFYIVFLAIYFVINLIGVTYKLMKSLYFADDNKTLITLPVSSNLLFSSKIFVALLYEIKKSMDLLVPVTLGIIGSAVFTGLCSFGSIPQSLLVLLLLSCLTIVLGSFLSVLFLAVSNFMKRFPVTELIALILGLSIIIAGIVFAIGLIPKNIDLQNEWPSMRQTMQEAIEQFSIYVYPITFSVKAMTGKLTTSFQGSHYLFNYVPVVYTLIIVGIIVLLLAILFLSIKKFYFYMATKSFEFNKELLDDQKENKVRKKYVTFVNKELRLTFRDVEISGTFVIVYILVPLLLYLIDTMFSAINTGLQGNTMSYAFNILLMCVPYLASNSIISTMYSKEARAGYVKKTKPIEPVWPLTTKLLPNLVLSIPSIIACCVVFYGFSKTGILATIMLGFAILFVQYAHIFYSATLDIMNPQNEAYATEGDGFNNPNENRSTIFAFIASIVFALLSYALLQDSYARYLSYNGAFIKIACIGLVAFGTFFMMWILKIRAYYFRDK